MGITSAGMGSGIDINSLVSQLVAAESKPAYDAIQRRESSIQTEFSALGTLKSSLSFLKAQIQALGSSELYNTYQATSSDTTIFSAAAGTTALPGSYVVQVTQLAEAQKSISTTEYANASAILGTGTITFTSGSGVVFSALVGGTGTLTDVSDAINAATGNFGVSASIVNVDSTVTPGTTIAKLVLTSNQVGIAHGFTLSGIVNGESVTPVGVTSQRDAKDAIISIDGQTATRGSNSITDVVNGLVINLQKANPGTNLQLNVSKNTGAISTAITNFVSSYNAFSKSMSELTHIGSDSADRGSLAGDAGVRNLINNTHADLSRPVAGTSTAFNSLAMIGVSIDQYGVMALDNTKFSNALSQDPNAVETLFSSTQDGIVTRLNHKVDPYLSSGMNLINSGQSSLEKQMKSLENKRGDVKHRMDGLEQLLLKQYLVMDQLVSKYKSIGPMVTNAFRAFEKHDD